MPKEQKKPNASLFGLVVQYRWWIASLAILTIAANALNLAVPEIISNAIDGYAKGSFVLADTVKLFFGVAVFIAIFTYLQSMVQTFAAERIARNIRQALSIHISGQDNAFIQRITPAKLLTNLTSDVDAVKNFVSQAIASIISSAFLIVGASILLLFINWKLALVVLTVIPIVGATFFAVFSQIRKLFKRAQEVIDWLNKVINESILGSSLIRLLNSRQPEYEKFLAASTEAKSIGMSILRLFASLIPVITFSVNLATLAILSLGGYFVIESQMTLGNFTAFNSYLAILIFPIIIIGFMSNVIAQASASYQRINEVLLAKPKEHTGVLVTPLLGNVSCKNVSVIYGEKTALKNISFTAEAATKTAIIGPTAAGKTQLLYLLTGLLEPTSGVIEYDGKNIDAYDKAILHSQVGFVFQDSIMFNLTLRENIAFNNTVKDEDLQKAVETAELHDFIDALPEKMDTIISERGTSLSGGQKQRIMLARALALNPKVLLLDDFTARVDANTEQKVLANVQKNYPNITLISVTQKIAPVEKYDQILLLMDGEILARGTHQELMRTSPEYVQIFDSQKSTNVYELPA